MTLALAIEGYQFLMFKVRPLILCDSCGEEVKDAKQALVQTSSIELGIQKVEITHKGKCDKHRGDPDTSWQILNGYLYRLSQLLEIDDS